jgi:hypothetical protein
LGSKTLSPTDTDFTAIGANITQFSLASAETMVTRFVFASAFYVAGDSSDSDIACKTFLEVAPLPPLTARMTLSGLHLTFVSTQTMVLPGMPNRTRRRISSSDGWETQPKRKSCWLQIKRPFRIKI